MSTSVYTPHLHIIPPPSTSCVCVWYFLNIYLCVCMDGHRSKFIFNWPLAPFFFLLLFLRLLLMGIFFFILYTTGRWLCNACVYVLLHHIQKVMILIWTLIPLGNDTVKHQQRLKCRRAQQSRVIVLLLTLWVGQRRLYSYTHQEQRWWINLRDRY